MPMDNRLLRPRRRPGQAGVIYLVSDVGEYLVTDDGLYLVI
jgi:hypothetical protein